MLTEYLGRGACMPMPDIWIVSIIHVATESVPLIWTVIVLMILWKRNNSNVKPRERSSYAGFLLSVNIYYSLQAARLSGYEELCMLYILCSILFLIYGGVNYKWEWPGVYMELIAIHFLLWTGISALFYKLFILHFAPQFESISRLLSILILSYGVFKLYIPPISRLPMHLLLLIYYFMVALWFTSGILLLDLVYIIASCVGAIIAISHTMAGLLQLKGGERLALGGARATDRESNNGASRVMSGADLP